MNTNAYDKILQRHFIAFVIYWILFVALYYAVKYFIPSTEPFHEAQIGLSNVLVVVMYAHLGWVLYYHRHSLKTALGHFFSEPVSPYNLAIFRIVFYVLLMLMYGYQYSHTFAIYTPGMQLTPLPFTAWYLPIIPLSRPLFENMYYAGCVVAILSAIGAGNKYIGWLNMVFSFYLIGMPMFLGKMFYMHLWFWVSSFMAFAPSSQVLSVDYLVSKLRKQQVDTTPHLRYGMALKFLWLHLGIVYFFSAMGKLKHTGLNWALGSSMINQIQLEWLQNYYETIPAFRIDNYPVLAHSGGVFILWLELLFLFLTISRAYRWLATAGGIMLHQLAAWLMNITFYDLQFLYTSYININAFKKQQRPFSGNELFNELKRNKTLKVSFVIGSLYFAVNSLFGFFNTDSWPFSCYPEHSANVPATFKRIEFEIQSPSGIWIKVDSIGKKNKFRKDNYFIIDEKVVRNYENNDTAMLKENLHLLWKIWQSNNPELQFYHSPKAFLVETPICPEERNTMLQYRQIPY